MLDTRGISLGNQGDSGRAISKKGAAKLTLETEVFRAQSLDEHI
ncbi:MAG: hypothetical protein ACI9XU_000224 [Arenicella sp.]|jgi:hypothetical protein